MMMATSCSFQFIAYTIFKLYMCHCVGAYVLNGLPMHTDQMRGVKGHPSLPVIYYMLVKAVLYVVPFAIFFGFLWQTYLLIVIDMAIYAAYYIRPNMTVPVRDLIQCMCLIIFLI